MKAILFLADISNKVYPPKESIQVYKMFKINENLFLKYLQTSKKSSKILFFMFKRLIMNQKILCFK